MWMLIFSVSIASLTFVTSEYNKYNNPTPRLWHVNQYPDPWWFPEECNRINKSAICDPNGIITQTEADKIDKLIEAVALDTRCPCYDCVSNQRGYVVRVAIMEEMEPLLSPDRIMNRLENTRRFAYYLTKRWKLTGNCNETLLIVYSRVDNVVYTMPGSRAGVLLTDDLIVEISMDVRPYFDSRETIAVGLAEMIKQYRDVFNKEYKKKFRTSKRVEGHPTGGQTNTGSYTSWTPCLLVLSMIILLTS